MAWCNRSTDPEDSNTELPRVAQIVHVQFYKTASDNKDLSIPGPSHLIFQSLTYLPLKVITFLELIVDSDCRILVIDMTVNWTSWNLREYYTEMIGSKNFVNYTI